MASWPDVTTRGLRGPSGFRSPVSTGSSRTAILSRTCLKRGEAHEEALSRSPTRSRRTPTGATASRSLSQDVIFTLQTILNPKNDVAGRAGYEDVARARAIDSKTLRLTFKKPYAAWKLLFYGQFGVLPKHALQGKDFNEVWNTNVNSQTTGKPIGSGPFILESYTKGQSMTMVRNPRYLRQAAEDRQDRLPVHHQHRLGDPGDQGRRGRRDLPAAAAPARRPPADERAQGPLERRCDVRAHRLQRRQEGLPAGEGSVVPAGIRLLDRPHRPDEAAVRQLEA